MNKLMENLVKEMLTVMVLVKKLSNLIQDSDIMIITGLLTKQYKSF